MPKSKKSNLKSIQSYEKLIEEHQQKIFDALESGKNLQFVNHWEKDIQNFRQSIQKLKRKLKA